MRALLAADYLSRLDTFPFVYPSYRVLGLEMGAPAIPTFDPADPRPYRRAVWTARQRGRRALRDLEAIGLLKRRTHADEGNGAQRANDYVALTPALVVELLVRGAGWSGLPPRDRMVPPRGPDGVPFERDRDPDREPQQQPAPPSCSAPQPVSAVAAVAPSTACTSLFPTSKEGSEGGLDPASRPSASPPSELAAALDAPPPLELASPALRARLWQSLPAHAASILAMLSLPAIAAAQVTPAQVERAVDKLLAAYGRQHIANPTGYVRAVLTGQGAAAPPSEQEAAHAALQREAALAYRQLQRAITRGDRSEEARWERLLAEARMRARVFGAG
jgi:hypothetical protein